MEKIKTVAFAPSKELELIMEWKIYKNGIEVETASCIYDALDLVCMIEYPNEDFRCYVCFFEKKVHILKREVGNR